MQYEVYNFTFEILLPKKFNLNPIQSLDTTLSVYSTEKQVKQCHEETIRPLLWTLQKVNAI